jgi:hypothetical protein
MRRLAIAMAAIGITTLAAGSATAGNLISYDDSYLVGTRRAYANAYTAWVASCRCYRVQRKARARYRRPVMHR